MSNIKKNYLRILEVIRSLNYDSPYRSNVGIKFKMTDIEVFALSLVAEYMSIDSENDLFKQLTTTQISNLIERS